MVTTGRVHFWTGWSINFTRNRLHLVSYLLSLKCSNFMLCVSSTWEKVKTLLIRERVKGCALTKIQWNLDIIGRTKGLAKFVRYTVVKLYRGFPCSSFIFIYFTITEVKKVVRYTEDLYRGSLNRGSTVEGNSVLWTCKIQGAQHMICMKKLQCSSRPWAKVGRQGHQALIENSPACYKWSIGVWSDCVLYIPLILSGRPNECWLLTCPQCAIATCRIAGSSGRPQ